VRTTAHLAAWDRATPPHQQPSTRARPEARRHSLDSRLRHMRIQTGEVGAFLLQPATSCAVHSGRLRRGNCVPGARLPNRLVRISSRDPCRSIPANAATSCRVTTGIVFAPLRRCANVSPTHRTGLQVGSERPRRFFPRLPQSVSAKHVPALRNGRSRVPCERPPCAAERPRDCARKWPLRLPIVSLALPARRSYGPATFCANGLEGTPQAGKPTRPASWGFAGGKETRAGTPALRGGPHDLPVLRRPGPHASSSAATRATPSLPGFERRAAARRDVRQLVLHPRHGRDRISTAHDGYRALLPCLNERGRDRARPASNGGVSNTPIGPSRRSFGAQQACSESCLRGLVDVEEPPSLGDRVSRHGATLARALREMARSRRPAAGSASFRSRQQLSWQRNGGPGSPARPQPPGP